MHDTRRKEMETMAGTLTDMFRESVRKFPEVPALMGKAKGSYMPITYRQMALKVRSFGRGLIALGVQRKDHIALLSENRPEWAIADMSFVHIGAVNVATFANSPTNQVECIISDSESKVMVVSGLTQLKKAVEIRNRNKHLKIIAMEPPPDGTVDVVTFNEVIELGDASPETNTEFENACKTFSQMTGQVLFTHPARPETRKALSYPIITLFPMLKRHGRSFTLRPARFFSPSFLSTMLWEGLQTTICPSARGQLLRMLRVFCV
jgi:long-subunit acyl-CoA synthetase (AMP-forming)